MKIVAINASHRGERGLTHFFIDRLLHGARAAGADGDVITLAKCKIQRCLSCDQCQTGAPHLTCVYNGRDDMHLIFAELAAADLIIYGTPVYMMSMSSLLKTLLERMYSTMDIRDAHLVNGLIHHHVNSAISAKPFVTLVVGNNVETATYQNVTAYFRTYARFMGARQVGVLVRNAALLFNGEEANLSQKFPKICAVCRAYEQAGRELATHGYIKCLTQRRANQEVVPVPCFGLLKHLQPVKQQVIAYLRKERK